jgi:hypothetical protein
MNTAEEYFVLLKEITEELGIQENPGRLFTACEIGHRPTVALKKKVVAHRGR